MDQIEWFCSFCKKQGIVECEKGPFNAYIEGYKVYRDHEKQSSDCPLPFTTIEIKKSYQVILNELSMQNEIDRIKRLGGEVEVSGNKIIIHSGIIPAKVIDALTDRIKKLDIDNLLDVEIKYENKQ